MSTNNQLDLTTLQPTKLHEPTRFFVYGAEFSGKTTLAADGASAIIMDANDGSALLSCVRYPFNTMPGKPHVPASWADVLHGIDTLATQPHGFDRLVLDCAGDFEALIWSAICTRDSQSDITKYGYGKDLLDVSLDDARARVVEALATEAVSYTHLTLPTTPYV